MTEGIDANLASTKEYSQSTFRIEGSKPLNVVPAEVEMVIQRSDLFPNFPVQGWGDKNSKIFSEALGVTIAPANPNKRKQLSFALPGYGRADFIPLIFESNDGTKFTTIYRRGPGSGNPEAGDFNASPLQPKGENAALADMNTTLAEAEEISEVLHNEGFRVRLPIAIFEVKSLVTEEGTKTIEELIETGILNKAYEKNRPFISLWAKRNPYSFKDALKLKDTKHLLKSQARFLKYDTDKDAQNVARLIETGKGEREWFIWMSKLAGQQFGMAASKGILFPSFHDHNISLAIESSDLGDDSPVKQPLSEKSTIHQKELYARQAINMLDSLTRLKEHFNKNSSKSLSSGVKELTATYLKAISQQDAANLLLEQMELTIDEFNFIGENESNKEMIKREIQHQKLILTLKSLLTFKKTKPSIVSETR